MYLYTRMQGIFSGDLGFWIKLVLASIILRYVLLAGGSYFVFYVWKSERFFFRKIQQKYPDKESVLFEIKYSTLTIVIFTVIVALLIHFSEMGYTARYNNISDYGWIYFFLSMPLMVFIHDTYFYFTHRLLHWKPLYKIGHKTHHYVLNPTPFASFAFHPTEAIVNAGFLPLMVFFVPWHPIAMLAFLSFSIFFNVYGHMGYEFFSKKVVMHPVGKWMNTSTHHNMHHTKVKYNFGLYFNVWDHLLGTNHPMYEATLEQVLDRK